jgi:pSer/pThr/pTyr-binding forkhead associated (FHA) protein
VVDIGGFHLTLEGDDQMGATTTFSLLGVSPPFANQTFMLPLGELPVGRVDGCAIVIHDPSISRKHATLTVSQAGVSVEDHDSSNGTWVNGVRVGRRTLKAGERLRFGNVEFEFMPAGHSTGLGVAARGWNRFSRADRTIQVALVIGLLSVILLAVTIVVAVRRSQGTDPPSGAGQTAEERYFAAIEAELATARTAAAGGSWEEAARAFQRALDRDPINREARRGLATAQGNMEDQKVLLEAESQLKAGKPEAALTTLQKIGPERHYAADAARLADRTRAAIAKDALGEARVPPLRVA